MKKIAFTGLLVATAALLTAVSTASAQEPAPAGEQPAAPGVDGWYYQAAPERTTPARLSVQKAQQRGAQRMARLDALRWYGFSNSRPTASALPWTTMYSPAWQQPGGRPFAWYVSHRPVIVIAHPTPIYR